MAKSDEQFAGTLNDTETDKSEDVTDLGDDPMLGLVLGGRYRIEQLIGSGGWANVYSGTHMTLGSALAIKVIHQHFARDAARQRRLEQEAKILSRLSSPYIVRTIDYGLTPVAFIVMEFVEGESLHSILNSPETNTQNRLSVPHALTLFQQLCEGLKAAHDLGLVHRDLKPHNILIKQTNQNNIECKILDFGIAKIIDDASGGDKMTATGDILGSPAYMPPEQWNGGEIDQRTDIYALGCVMYEALTGCPIFQANSSYEYLNMHMNEPIKPFSKVAAGSKIPHDLEKVVLKCVQKESSDRYDTTQSILHDLEKIRLGKAVKVRIAANKRKEPPNKTLVLLACATLLIGGSMAGAWFWREPLGMWYSTEQNLKADAQAKLGKPAVAIKLYRDVLFVTQILPPQSQPNLHAMQKLSDLLRTNGSFAESEEFRKKLRKTIGDVEPAQIMSLLRNARQLANMRNPMASKVAQQAVIMAGTYGPKSIILAKAMHVQGGVLRDLGKTNQSLDVLNQSLKMTEELLEPDDIPIARRLHEISLTLVVQGRNQQAAEALERAIPIGIKNKDMEELPRWYHNLATAYANLKQYDKAIAAENESARIIYETGASPDLKANVENNLGCIYMRTKNYTKSEAAFKRALAAREGGGSTNQLGTEDIWWNLAFTYREERKYKQSLDALHTGMNLLVKVNPNHPSVKLFENIIKQFESEQVRYAKMTPAERVILEKNSKD